MTDRAFFLLRLLQVILYVAAFGLVVVFAAGSVAAAFGPRTAAALLVLGLLLYVGQSYLPRGGSR